MKTNIKFLIFSIACLLLKPLLAWEVEFAAVIDNPGGYISPTDYVMAEVQGDMDCYIQVYNRDTLEIAASVVLIYDGPYWGYTSYESSAPGVSVNFNAGSGRLEITGLSEETPYVFSAGTLDYSEETSTEYGPSDFGNCSYYNYSTGNYVHIAACLGGGW